jgi:hypothetical protein
MICWFYAVFFFSIRDTSFQTRVSGNFLESGFATVGKINSKLVEKVRDGSLDVRQRGIRQTILRWNSDCDAIVSDFETVSEKRPRDVYCPDAILETQTKHYNLALKNMSESPICLLSRISNILWYLQAGVRGGEAHSGNHDKGWARTSSYLQRLS